MLIHDKKQLVPHTASGAPLAHDVHIEGEKTQQKAIQRHAILQERLVSNLTIVCVRADELRAHNPKICLQVHITELGCSKRKNTPPESHTPGPSYEDQSTCQQRQLKGSPLRVFFVNSACVTFCFATGSLVWQYSSGANHPEAACASDDTALVNHVLSFQADHRPSRALCHLAPGKEFGSSVLYAGPVRSCLRRHANLTLDWISLSFCILFRSLPASLYAPITSAGEGKLMG